MWCNSTEYQKRRRHCNQKVLPARKVFHSITKLTLKLKWNRSLTCLFENFSEHSGKFPDSLDFQTVWKISWQTEKLPDSPKVLSSMPGKRFMSSKFIAHKSLLTWNFLLFVSLQLGWGFCRIITQPSCIELWINPESWIWNLGEAIL